MTWSDAQHRCRDLAAGSHLADLKTLEDLLFLSSHLLRRNDLLLLWTGLKDQQVASLQKHTLLNTERPIKKYGKSYFLKLSSCKNKVSVLQENQNHAVVSPVRHAGTCGE